MGSITNYGVLVIAIGNAIVTDYGSKYLRRPFWNSGPLVTLFAGMAVIVKAITLTRNAGRYYRTGATLYNTGMPAFKNIHVLSQAHFILLDLVMIG